MGHTTASSTVRVPVSVHYICSKCGAEVTFEHVVRGEGKASENVLFIKETTQRDLENEALQTAKAATGKKLRQICQEMDKGRYDAAEFCCECSRCGHQEPWAKLRFSKGDSAIRNLFWAALLLSAVSIWFGAAYASLVAVWLLYKVGHRRNMYQQIQKLPIPSHPQYRVPAGNDLAPTQEDVHRIRESYPAFRAAFRGWYCRWAEGKPGQVSTKEEAVDDFIDLLETCVDEKNVTCLYLCQSLFLKGYTFYHCFADTLMEQLYVLKSFPTEENRKKIVTNLKWMTLSVDFVEETGSYQHY